MACRFSAEATVQILRSPREMRVAATSGVSFRSAAVQLPAIYLYLAIFYIASGLESFTIQG